MESSNRTAALLAGGAAFFAGTDSMGKATQVARGTTRSQGARRETIGYVFHPDAHRQDLDDLISDDGDTFWGELRLMLERRWAMEDPDGYIV